MQRREKRVEQTEAHADDSVSLGDVWTSSPEPLVTHG
jgi:hypothetical protein